jgi:hypothetical protein
VGSVVDADGVEFAKDIFAEQAVELGAKDTIQVVQIHDRDGMPNPSMIGEPKLQRYGYGLSHDSGPF